MPFAAEYAPPRVPFFKCMRPDTMPTPLHGLYALTPDDCPNLLAAATRAMEGGARLLQYRDKTATATARGERARALLALCRARGVPMIVNDDLELALAAGCDGVHLGATDTPIADARARFPDGLIGASCYNAFPRAETAARAGASYVAFGCFHPSPTRPDAPPASPELLMRARRELSIPVCAIGGIQADNAAALVTAGAHLLAVCNGLFATPDIRDAARDIVAAFEPDA